MFIEELQSELTKQNVYFLKLLNDVKHVEDHLNKLLYLEIYTFLIDHNLNYTDKAGMANSVEIRVPYLDLDLVNLQHCKKNKILVHIVQRHRKNDAFCYL